MVIFLYNLYIFGIHLRTVLYSKLCYNELCYKEVVVYYDSPGEANTSFVVLVYTQHVHCNTSQYFHFDINVAIIRRKI